MRVPIKLLALLLVAASVHAQDPATLTTPPSDEQIASYLHSGDQRLIAWGAAFTLQAKDSNRLADLFALSENWRPIQPYAGAVRQLDQSTLERKFAMQLVLDTIIQMQATPPTGSLLNLANDFPMQTAILLTRIAPGEAQQTLHELYFDSGYSSPVIKRVAADLLAQNPPEGFAASLLTNMSVTVTVLITSPGQPDFGGGPIFGDCVTHKQRTPSAGWPPLYQYTLFDSPPDRDQNDFLILATPDAISARRKPGPQDLTNCGDAYLTDEHRQKLISQMLGVPNDKLGWQASDSTIIHFTSVADYNMLLPRFTAAYVDRLRATNLALQQKGLLTADEAGTASPHIRFWIDDRRPDRSIALPIPPSPGNNIIYEKSPWALY